MNGKRIVFREKCVVGVEPFEVPPVGAREILARTLVSQMSTGTENICLTRSFESGSHWDAWVRYPHFPGYSVIAEVMETGPEVDDLQPGDRVALAATHSSHHVVSAEEAVPVPSGFASEDAVWFTLALIAFMGARAAQYTLGDSVLIIGAGPVGQMSVRWAAAAGLGSIIAVDPVEMRLDLAERGGATATIAQSASECREAVLLANEGRRPRVVNDATGNQDVFAAALTLAADFGRVVILGDTGTPTGQHLTKDVIRRGLTIVGAHGSHVDSQWNSRTIPKLFFELAQRGRFDLGGLNTHFFEPDDAPAAYELANTDRPSTMGIIFRWAN